MQRRRDRLVQHVKNRRWLRNLLGFLLVVCGVLGPLLPVLGIWMLPLGLILLSADFPWAQRWHDRIRVWLRRRGYHH